MKKNTFLVLCFLCAFWAGWEIKDFLFPTHVGVVLLANKSSQLIVDAQVVVCGQTLTFSDIPKKEYVAARYNMGGDSHYNTTVRLQSGGILEQEVGYLTNGADFFGVFEVTNNEIIPIDHNMFPQE